MPKKILVLCAAALALGLAGWFWLLPRTDSGALTLHGNVDVRQVDLSFRVDGRIAAVLVEEGENVAAGTPLARLDADLLTQARDAAAAQLHAAQARLDMLTSGYRPEEVAQAAAELTGATAALTSANAELRRITELRKTNAVSPKDMDNARSAQEQARARMKAAAEQSAMLTRGYRNEDIRAQRATTEAAAAQLQRAEIQLADATLTAPSAGVVLTRTREAGAIVQAGQTVYTLSLTDPVWLRVYVEEPDLGRVKPGMPVQVSVDCAPDKTYAGTVGFISPAAEFAPKSVETRDVRASLVYRVRVRAEDPENVMRQGMPVRVLLNAEPR